MVKVNFETLPLEPYRHDRGYSFCPIAFKLHKEVVGNKRMNPLDFVLGVKGESQL